MADSSLLGSFFWAVGSACLAGLIASRAIKKKSLNVAGGIAATIVGFISFFAGFKFGITLIIFFYSSSKITKIGSHIKRSLEEEFKEGGQRDQYQVFCNACSGIISCLAHLVLFQWQNFPLDSRFPLPTFLQAAYLGHYACCAGDTWASELGVLQKSRPFLLTSCRRVPTGTNGAVSVVGLLVSGLGGTLMGVTFYLASLTSDFVNSPSTSTSYPWLFLFFATSAGLLGSLIDSLLGATMQYSGWNEAKKRVVAEPSPDTQHISGVNLLSNNQVNLVSSIATSLISGVIALYIF
eukprot:TRINITY_DN5787_c0_g1_i4.p1 TRINITY_DN5787_c0_g1~~TRINITY_DN5787_c0_g1_i4.p1  ORF type:complete len:311 (+),score=41.27 TRINITY_DN5787_c0_g1_i4:52-933(+)